MEGFIRYSEVRHSAPCNLDLAYMVVLCKLHLEQRKRGMQEAHRCSPDRFQSFSTALLVRYKTWVHHSYKPHPVDSRIMVAEKLNNSLLAAYACCRKMETHKPILSFADSTNRRYQTSEFRAADLFSKHLLYKVVWPLIILSWGYSIPTFRSRGNLPCRLVFSVDPYHGRFAILTTETSN